MRNSNKTVSECLYVLIQQIAKISALVPETGLLTGKIGIAILLYHYARYRNDMKIKECVENLMNIAVHEISLEAGKDFESGLCGIAWGIDYLMKQGFVEADEDIFDEIDIALLQENIEELNTCDLETESETLLYLWNRLKFSEPSAKKSGKKILHTTWKRFKTLFFQDTRVIHFPCFNVEV